MSAGTLARGGYKHATSVEESTGSFLYSCTVPSVIYLKQQFVMDRQDPALRRLGGRITDLREKQQLTIAELAALTGIDAGDIVLFEAGAKDIQLTILFSLARGLGVTAK